MAISREGDPGNNADIAQRVAQIEPKAQVEIMQAVGLNNRQIISLDVIRHRCAKGTITELTMEYRKLSFARFLHERGLIDG